jgi:hypothetical protein
MAPSWLCYITPRWWAEALLWPLRELTFMLLLKHLSRYSEDERMTAVLLLKEAREKPNIRAGDRQSG